MFSKTFAERNRINITFNVKQAKKDWVAETSVKFKSQLNLKCKLICKFQVHLNVI
jgi:hypothetical protein